MAVASPFAGFENFAATFTVAGDSLEQDDRGNWRPTTVAIAVIAVMELLTLPQQYRRPRDIDVRSIYIGGYLVNPRPLPTTITPDSPCTATFNGLHGSFVMEYTGRDPYLQTMNIDLVDEIKGWFIPSSFAAIAP